MEDYKYLVRVSCLTYNHAAYIKDAMGGFCMQETTFPFVCTIIDDASTDGESELIINYLKEQFDLEDKSMVRHEDTNDYMMIFARHKTNYNCYFAVFFLKYNHYSVKKSKRPYLKEWTNNAKYIALCEGDDYWVDPQKLQKQVSLMEHHPTYALCHGDVNLLNSRNNSITNNYNKIISEKYKETNGDIVFDYLINFEIGIRTATTFFRTDLYLEILKEREMLKQPSFMMGDVQVWLDLAKKGSVAYIDEVLAVYRRSQGTASNASNIKQRMAFSLSSIEMRLYYLNKYNKTVSNITKERFDKAMIKAAVYEVDLDVRSHPALYYEKNRKRFALVRKYSFIRSFYRIIYWLQNYIDTAKSVIKKRLGL